MATIPSRYKYLSEAPMVPVMVRLAMDAYGTLEAPGTPNNPKILGWADEVARMYPGTYNNWAADWYNSDSVPWCGLFMAAMCARTALDYRAPPKNYLAALSWADWGTPVQWKGREGVRLDQIWVGDVAVFVRSGGGHVGIIIGVTADGKNLVVLGGNQSDKVTISEFPLSRVYAIRRPIYRTVPAGARHVRVSSTGIVSTKES